MIWAVCRPKGMNYFAYPTAAERYANARPFFHPLAATKIQTVCCEGVRIDRALDVGCGTGQSAIALLEVADEIVGVDSSAEMVSQAIHHEHVCYIKGRAEQLPFDAASFGLLTVAGAFHWFDQRQFMLEARRVLRPDGWLVVYNDRFCGRMIGNNNYESWHREYYLVRYPTPPRNSSSLTESNALAFGFEPYGTDNFTHEVEFTPDRLVSYLLTQTNVIAAVEAGREDLQAVARWLQWSIQPLFTQELEKYLFSCDIQFLR
jgi:SAM-dependent methyltransferase